MIRRAASIVAVAVLSITAQAALACSTPANAAGMLSQIGAATNEARGDAGLSALSRDALLDMAAQRHACWMATSGEFSHTGKGQSQPSDRIAQTGYTARLTSENIAMGQVSAQEVVADWMTSAGHRANILRTGVVDFGAGVAESDGRPIWVMIYATPM